MSYETQLSKGQYQTTVKTTTKTLVRSVYIWMCTALLLTGATAQTPTAHRSASPMKWP